MMAFNPAVSFNPLLTPTTTKPAADIPSPSTATSTATTTPSATTAAAAANATPNDPLRFLAASNPLFQQLQFPQQAMMAQALAAQAAHAQAFGLGSPVVFPPGMAPDFKPEMLMQHGPMPVLMDNSHFYHPYSLEGMKKRNATKEATEPLKTWLRAHQKNPYPTKGDKVLLAMQTRMTLTQVSTWFANARRRLKKENKMTWSPQNRRGDCDDDDFDNDDDDLNRPSSSTSSADRKDDIFKLDAKRMSPTPSGGSSDDLLTPKKPKIWSIADVASEDSDVKKDSSPSSDENTASNLLSEAMRSQKAIQENLMAIARNNPHLMSSMRMMNPAAGFMFNPMQLFALNMQHQAQQAAAAAAAAAAASVNLPQSQGLQSEESGTTPTSEASPAQSPKAPTISPAPRTATPAY